MFEKISKAGLKLKPSKCEFFNNCFAVLTLSPTLYLKIFLNSEVEKTLHSQARKQRNAGICEVNDSLEINWKQLKANCAVPVLTDLTNYHLLHKYLHFITGTAQLAFSCFPLISSVQCQNAMKLM